MKSILIGLAIVSSLVTIPIQVSAQCADYGMGVADDVLCNSKAITEAYNQEMVNARDSTYDLPTSAEELMQKCLSQANKGAHQDPQQYCTSIASVCQQGTGIEPPSIKQCYDMWFVKPEAFSNEKEQTKDFSGLDSGNESANFGGLQ